ncbi:MAG: hypothetical protein JJE25_14070 [Bacteroidia bacterium]|nr:hypothetical protein [Bacteroidia bacterium]
MSSCKHEPIKLETPNSDEGGNNNGSTTWQTVVCDPDTVYFQNDILPLFISNCAKSGCHDLITHKEGIILNNYSNIMTTGEIRPFDVSHGDIYEVITESDPDKIMPSPPNAQLTQDQINMIYTWINQGALNNSCSGDCDTLNVTYLGTLVPILQSFCIGCHNSVSAGGNIMLNNYSGVQTVALNGKLFGAVNHDAGYYAMPKNGNKLPQCKIDEIRIWIANGTLNN